jgi:hypothetical protein
MRHISGIGLRDVQTVYSGAEGQLWELVMGQQVHVGGLRSSMDLAQRAGIGGGMSGADLCCCTGAGMRFLVRFRNVARMHGVDATPAVVEQGRQRCAAEGLADKITFTLADACQTGLRSAEFDFVWGEDAWCYVVDKATLIGEAERFLRFMKFANIQSLDGYKTLLAEAGCEIVAAEDTGRFAPCVDLYIEMLEKQLGYDALRILGFDAAVMEGLAAEMQFTQQLAHAGKLAQGLFVARKKG